MNTLFVYPTSRKILSNLLSSDNVVLDKSIAIDEFFKKASFIENKTKLNQESRIIFLKKAILKVNKDIGLGNEFKKNFLFFLKNSSFIFKFFDEIFAEKSSLDDIETSDLSGEFIDHIEVLKEVYDVYKELLFKQDFYDSSTAMDYQINKSFLKEYDRIELILEGYLNKKEFDIIYKCSQITPFDIRLYSTSYNKKMFCYFKKDFKPNMEYLLDLSNNEIKEEIPIKSNTIFEVCSFEHRISQCAFVTKKIHDFLEVDKFKAENIVVITPDETFASTLKQMDLLNNLNFAMGISFSKSLIYQKLQTLYEGLLDLDIENQKRIDSFSLNDFLKQIKINKDRNSFSLLLEIIDILSQDLEEEVKYIITQEVYFFKNLEKELSQLSFSELLSYFLYLLRSKTISHKDGGKIKVIGVLESRNISFDGVIIIDFNDDIVPRISQKDIFLNSQIRKFSNIPTKTDRENLQKYYYKRIFDNSKKVAISYVSSDEKIASKFLINFNIKDAKQNTDYDNLLFDKSLPIKHFYQDKFTYINTNKTISFNKLHTFIECKQKFYNQYVLKLKLENDASNEMSRLDFGIILHNILKNIKTTKELDLLKADISKVALRYKNGINNHMYFEILKFVSNIDDFIKYLKKQFKDGFKVYATEKDFDILYKDFRLRGRIDKIEVLNSDNYKEVHIVDYKISKKPKKLDTKSLQLYIYYLAVKKDFKNANIITYNHYLPSNEKLIIDTAKMQEEFDEYLEEYTKEFDVEKCENSQICRYCDYSIMCNRG